jgi:hypothetical protein
VLPLSGDSGRTLAAAGTATHHFSSPARRRMSASRPVCVGAIRTVARHFSPGSSPPWRLGGLPVAGGVLAGFGDGSAAGTVGSGS